MKTFEFHIKFNWNMFLGVYWQYVSIGSDKGLTPQRWEAIIWSNDDPRLLMHICITQLQQTDYYTCSNVHYYCLLMSSDFKGKTNLFTKFIHDM